MLAVVLINQITSVYNLTCHSNHSSSQLWTPFAVTYPKTDRVVCGSETSENAECSAFNIYAEIVGGWLRYKH